MGHQFATLIESNWAQLLNIFDLESILSKYNIINKLK